MTGVGIIDGVSAVVVSMENGTKVGRGRGKEVGMLGMLLQQSLSS